MLWLLIVRSLMIMTIWIQKRNIIRIPLSLNLRHECNKNIIWWPVLIFKCIHYLLSRIATDENELSRVIFLMLILNLIVALPFSSEHIAFIILCCEYFGILQIRECIANSGIHEINLCSFRRVTDNFYYYKM